MAAAAAVVSVVATATASHPVLVRLLLVMRVVPKSGTDWNLLPTWMPPPACPPLSPSPAVSFHFISFHFISFHFISFRSVGHARDPPW